jgi:hypothetical protein
MRSPLGGRAFPLGALLFLLLILVHLPYAWPGGPFLHHPRPLTLLVDEGTLLYDGYRTALGEVMYRDFFEFQGPVQYYLLGLLFSWSGPSIGAARVLQIAVWALSALLLALVTRRFCGVAASAAVALIHASIYVLALPVTYAHWLAEFFVLLAILLLTRRQATPASDVGAGLALGLAVMTIQSMGIPALVAAAGTAALPASPRAARGRRPSAPPASLQQRRRWCSRSSAASPRTARQEICGTRCSSGRSATISRARTSRSASAGTG